MPEDLTTSLDFLGLPEQDGDESTAAYLQRLQKSGFIFHGTGNELTSLEPRRAHDPISDWNSDTAVYGSDWPVWSTIFAVYKSVARDSWRTSSKSGENGDKCVAYIDPKYKERMEKTFGWVYILPPDSFVKQDENSRQYKSSVPVTPVGKVMVTLQDYYDMGGEIVWGKVDLKPPKATS